MEAKPKNIFRKSRGTGKNILLSSDIDFVDSLLFKSFDAEPHASLKETLFQFRTDSKQNLFYIKDVSSDFETAFHIGFVDEITAYYNNFFRMYPQNKINISKSDFIQKNFKENWSVKVEEDPYRPNIFLHAPKNYDNPFQLKWLFYLYSETSSSGEQAFINLTGINKNFHINNVLLKDKLMLNFDLPHMKKIMEKCLRKETRNK